MFVPTILPGDNLTTIRPVDAHLTQEGAAVTGVPESRRQAAMAREDVPSEQALAEAISHARIGTIQNCFIMRLFYGACYQVHAITQRSYGSNTAARNKRKKSIKTGNHLRRWMLSLQMTCPLHQSSENESCGSRAKIQSYLRR